jgi:hypothetical protein
MPVALSAIRDELLPGLFDVRGEYDQIPKVWDKIFTVKKSEMAVERSTQMRFLTLPSYKAEGSATTFDNNAGQRFTWNFVNQAVALGYAITREAIDDNLYKTQFQPTNLGLKTSFAQFKEIVTANVLNNATTYNTQLGGDGVALCSTAHPYDFGTWANRPSVDVDLNESSLLNAQTSIPQNFVDEAGLRIQAEAERLVVPQALEPIALRLLKAQLQPNAASNNPNVIPLTAGGVKDYICWRYLTSTTAWFLTTNIKGLIVMDRNPFEMDMWVDNVTDNLLVKAYERYSQGYNDPRCIWGSFPSA